MAPCAIKRALTTSLKFFEAVFSTRMLTANAITSSVTRIRIPNVRMRATPLSDAHFDLNPGFFMKGTQGMATNALKVFNAWLVILTKPVVPGTRPFSRAAALLSIIVRVIWTPAGARLLMTGVELRPPGPVVPGSIGVGNSCCQAGVGGG